MKITKSRLLQIIREEVELHEKNIFELDQEELEDISTEKEADTDGDGKISKPEAKAVIDAEAKEDKNTGNVRIRIKGSKKVTDEDKLFDPKTKKPLNNKKQNDI